MDQSQQIEIVEDLLDSIRFEIVEAIKNGKIPTDWNGLQLRLLVEAKAKASADHAYVRLGREGLREFRNVVAVRNL